MRNSNSNIMMTGSERTKAVRSGVGYSLHAAWGAVAALIAMLALASPAAAQVPSIVATSQSTLTATSIGAGRTATDACGNVYINPNGNGPVVQIAAGTGVVTTVSANNNGYNNGTGLAIDASKTYLYYPTSSQWYGSQFTKMSIAGCVLGGTQVVGNNLGNLGNYYYGTAGNIAADAAGNVFFSTTCCSNGPIYEETAAGNPVAIQSSWANSITSLAVDASDNLYFTDGSANVYVLKPPYTSAATALGGTFTKPVGVSFDPLGNLLVADGSASMLYEIPLESSVLNVAHQFKIASATLTNAVAADSYGNYYLSNGTPTAIRPSSAQLASTAVGSTSASATVGYVFNASVTPAAISVVTGPATSGTFANASGSTCAAGTTYTATQTCNINVTFSPTAAGLQRAGVVMSTSAGAVLNAASLRGIGLSPAITIDPGTLTTLGAGFTTPTGITVGPDGTTYVTDAGANKVTVFPVGNTTGTVLSTGTITLKSPSAVAVDNLGDVYIADTGNNQIVEVPVINGVLTPASSVAYTAGLKAPAGITIGGAGNLYIADTGNNRMLFVPNQGGALNFALASTFGSGFSAPSAVALDPSGNVYVADSGNNAVVEFAAPLGSAASAKVISGLSTPTALATDASGAVFVADKGSASIYRYASTAGILGARSLVSNGVLNPTGVALDASGNLYVTDATNAVVNELARVQATVQFGGVNVGSTSAAGSAVVNSSGNQTVTFPTPSYSASGNTAAGFTVTSDGCATAASVAAGSACTISATFTPPAPELNAELDLTLKGNATAGTPKIALVGTGANIKPSTLALVLTSPTGTLNAGSAVAFTATLGTGGSTAMPGGSVKYSVNGSQVATVKLTNGVAVLTLPNGLPKGSVTVTAVYGGDVINYSGSSASLTLTVVALPTTLTLSITTPWTNPQSANDVTGAAQGPSIALSAVLGVGTAIIPGGTVSFYQGSSTSPTLLGFASIVAASGGTYQTSAFTTTALRAGTTNVVENASFLTTYNIYAVYSGDNSYSTSTSASAPVTIVAAPTCAGGTGTPFVGCPVEKTGATYAISPTSSAITIASSTTANTSGATTLTVTSYGGWTGVLNFTCAGLPQYATCNPYPGAPVVTDSTPTATQVPTQIQFIITTNVPPTPPTLSSSISLWLGALFGALLLVVRRRLGGTGLRRLCSLAGVALLMTASLAGLNGCSTTTGTTAYVTPTGTSNVTVTVHAAQLNASSSSGAVLANDVTVATLQVALTVK